MATLPRRGRDNSSGSGVRVPVSRSPSIASVGGERQRSRDRVRQRTGSRDRGGGAAWDSMQQQSMAQNISEISQQMRQLMSVVTQQQTRMDEMQNQILQGRVNPGATSTPVSEFDLFGPPRESQQVPTRPFMARTGSPETIRGSPAGFFPASVPRAAENPFGGAMPSSSSSSSSGVPGLIPGNPMFSQARVPNGPTVPEVPQQVPATDPVAAPRIVMPDGSSFPLGPINPGPGGAGTDSQLGTRELDAFQKSDKWLPAMPTIDSSNLKGRIEEITHFEVYVEQLVSWVGLVSNSFASEIAYSVRSAREISQESLSHAQVSRGLRLLNILKTSFNGIPKATVILNAYTERSANFLVNGFEALRRLSQEFCVRTRSEAMHFRSQVMSKTYKVSTVTELVNSMDYDIHRYAKLIGSLGPLVDRTGLDILPVDLSMILLRSLKTQIRQYVVMHAPSESYDDIRQAALRYESAQRLWQEVSTDPKSDDFYAHAVKGKGRGKKGDEKGKGKGKEKGKKERKDSKDSNAKESGKGGKSVAKPTDKCWNCGGLGHYGRDCKKPKSDGSGKGTKGKDSNQKGKQKGKGKGGKSNAVLGEEPNPEASPSNDGNAEPPLVSMIRFRNFSKDLPEIFPKRASVLHPKPKFQQTTKFAVMCQVCSCISCDSCGDSLDVSWEFDLHFISCLFLGDVDCAARCSWLPSTAICYGVQSKELRDEASWWLLDSGASYSVMGREFAQMYEIVDTLPFPKSIGGSFSAANGSSIIMKEFAVVAITVWARDLQKKHEPNRMPVNATVPVKIYIHALIAENIINNVISLGSVLRNGWKPSKDKDLLVLISDDQRFQLHIEHHQNCPWLRHEFDVNDSEWSSTIVGELPSGALDNWSMFEPLPDAAYQMPVQHASYRSDMQHSLSGQLPLHVSVKRDSEGNAIPLHRSHGKQKPVDVLPTIDDIPGMLEDASILPADDIVDKKGGPTGDSAALHDDLQLVETPADSEHPKVQQRRVELQKHVMRGHFPYSPECIQCRQGKSTYQHRRRKCGVDVHELSCDFFFYQQRKYLVMYDSHTGMTGFAPVGDLEQARKWIRHWVAEFGLLGPLSNNHALEVFTDSEKAVGALIRQADVGRPVKLQKAPPQGHETIGSAETSVRKLKDSMATLRSSLRTYGHDIADSGQAQCSAFAYLCFCHNSHSRFRDGQLAPRELVVGRSLPPVDTTMFCALTLAEIPESLKGKAIARFERVCYLRPEFSSLGHVCFHPEFQAFVAKSVKHLTPIQFDVKLGDGFIVQVSSNGREQPAEHKQQEIYEGAIDPSAVKSVPAQFIRDFGPTEGCTTCERKNFHANKHNRKCLERYRKHLRDEDAKLRPKVVDRPAEQPISQPGDRLEMRPAAQSELFQAERDEFEDEIHPEIMDQQSVDYSPTTVDDGHVPDAQADSSMVDAHMDVDLQPMPNVVEIGNDVDMPERMVVDALLEAPLHELDPVTLDKVRDQVVGLVPTTMSM